MKTRNPNMYLRTAHIGMNRQRVTPNEGGALGLGSHVGVSGMYPKHRRRVTACCGRNVACIDSSGATLLPSSFTLAPAIGFGSCERTLSRSKT